MVRPQRNSRRNVAGQTSDDGMNVSQSQPPVALTERTRSAQNVAATQDATFLSTKIETEARVVRKRTRNGGNTNSITSFFNSTVQQQDMRAEDRSNLLNSTTESELQVFQDDISDDDFANNVFDAAGQTSLLGKRKHGGFQEPVSGESARSKFLKLPRDGDQVSSREAQPRITIDQRPWTEKYRPSSLSELVVHKKKVQDVRQWMEAALSGSIPQSLLIIKGPAGCGKSTTVEILASALQVHINEWRNLAYGGALGVGQTSQSAAFEDFLVRSTQTKSLDLAGADVVTNSAEQTLRKDIVVIEEFPVLSAKPSSALDAFRSTILLYLAQSFQRWRLRDSPTPTIPLVLIITESTISGGGDYTENVTAHRLLGQDILNHPASTVMEFNPVAPSFIGKALQILVQKHRPHIHPDPPAWSAVIKSISEIGDLRNATSALEYMYAKMGGSASFALKTTSKRNSKAQGPTSLAVKRNVADDAFDLLAVRESSIGLFHAVGKVLYNKRSEDNVNRPSKCQSTKETAARPPPGLDLDRLADSTGTDVSTFVCALHENYLQSCYPTSGGSDASLQCVNGCIDAFSDSDLMVGRLSDRFSGSASEGVRQEEIAFEMTCRGVLDALPYPVKRQAPVTSGTQAARTFGRTDAHRMYFPASIKIWRPKEEKQALLDTFVKQALRGSLDVDLRPITQQWSRSMSQPGRFRSEPYGNALPVGSGSSARLELLLERLPYIACLILKSSEPSSGLHVSSKLLADVEALSAIHSWNNAEEEADSEEQTPRVKGANRGLPARNRSEEGIAIEKLVLSDDDIEDD